MAQAARVILHGHEATSKLDEMSLTPGALRESVEYAWKHHAVAVSAFEPANAQGSILYFKTVGTLRNKTRRLGYRQLRTTDGYELTVNYEKKIAIAVALGTDQTGNLDGGDPTNRRPKGRATRSAIDVNQQCWDFGDIKRLRSAVPGTETWLLLVCPDEANGEIRLELSLPARMERKFVTKWGPRIILDPISIAAPLEDKKTEEAVADVEVTRRSAN